MGYNASLTMTAEQRIILASQILFTAILAGLQFIDQKRIEAQDDGLWKHILQFAFEYNLWVAVMLALFLAVTAAVKDLYNPRQLQKEARRRILETMMEELFQDDKGNVRITVFKDANWIRYGLIWLVEFWRNARLWQGGNAFKLPVRGRYICVRERLGTEFTKSKTFLYYSPDTRHQCQGVAAVVRQSLEAMLVNNLPDIEGIDLSQIDIGKKKQQQVKAVREYMAKGHITDFESLKRIHRKAKHFYGNILLNKDGKPKGVLVIDSWRSATPFDEATVTKLSYYVKLLSSTM